MKDERVVGRFQLVSVIATIVLLALCLTWSPAYGYSMARIHDLAIQTDDSPGGSNAGMVLRTSITESPAYSDHHPWPAEPLSTRDWCDELPTACPPTVPEPATLLLLGLGLATGAAFRKTRS